MTISHIVLLSFGLYALGLFVCTVLGIVHKRLPKESRDDDGLFGAMEEPGWVFAWPIIPPILLIGAIVYGFMQTAEFVAKLIVPKSSDKKE